MLNQDDQQQVTFLLYVCVAFGAMRIKKIFVRQEIAGSELVNIETWIYSRTPYMSNKTLET